MDLFAAAKGLLLAKEAAAVQGQSSAEEESLMHERQPLPQDIKTSRTRRLRNSIVRRAKDKASLFHWESKGKLPKEQDKPQDSGKPRLTLGARFFALPVELQLETIKYLSFYELMNLRSSSPGFLRVTTAHESYIVRRYIRVCVPNYITKLYPPPSLPPPDLQYLTDLAYKQRVSTNLAYCLARQIVKDILRWKIGFSQELRAGLVNKLRRGMAPLIFALFQFFESYKREREQLDKKWISSDEELQIQTQILLRWPDMLLLQVHQMYRLLVQLFPRRMTSRTVPGLLRTLSGRRYLSKRPDDYSLTQILVTGGISDVWQIFRIKGFSRRWKALIQYKWPSYVEMAPQNLWTPAAEERLLARDIIRSEVDIVSTQRFVHQLLWIDSDGEEDDVEDGEIDDADSDDEEDDESGDDLD